MTVTVSPRCHRRHQRHSSFAKYSRSVKTIGSNQLNAFIVAQAARLGTTSAIIFAKLTKNTAHRIRTAAALGNLS
jgi:hypothetical protein